MKEENKGIQNSIAKVGEIFAQWTEIQMNFSHRFMEFKQHFETVLDEAKEVESYKKKLEEAEKNVAKVRKDARKSTGSIKLQMEKVNDAESEKDSLQKEVKDRKQRHELEKFRHVKEALYNLSDAYVDYGQNCEVLFKEQRNHIVTIGNTSKNKDPAELNTSSACALIIAKEKLKTLKRQKIFDESKRSFSQPTNSQIQLNNLPYNPFYHETDNIQPELSADLKKQC